jgi:GntR family transcriptional regulator, rspAB operon transcriptional repressor
VLFISGGQLKPMNFRVESYAHPPQGLIRDQVYRNLKKKILGLELEPGRLLSEKTLIEMLQVSRTPIREALVRLAQEGLVDTVPQKGSFISPIDMELVEESIFVRETLERAIVRQACEMLSSERIMQLDHLIRLQELAMEEKNYGRLFELDEEFHQTIIVGCGKHRTWQLLHDLSAQYHRIRILRLAASYDWQIILAQHQRIVQALREKDPDTAEKVMQEHIGRVRFEKDQLQEKYPTYFKQASK